MQAASPALLIPPPAGVFFSPLGLVPEHDPGDFRVIHDLSFPKGKGVNDLIPNELTSVNYEDFDHVVSLIQAAGPRTWISKVDIRHAFRIMPIHPSDVNLFGFHWQGQFYVDKCLPMGCTLSCALFETFPSALQSSLISNFSFQSPTSSMISFLSLSLSRSYVNTSSFIFWPWLNSRAYLLKLQRLSVRLTSRQFTASQWTLSKWRHGFRRINGGVLLT